MLVKVFINGVEIGMKAAQGETIDIPEYKMAHILPTDMMETTGTVTNLKDGKQLAIKPLTTLIECPYTHSNSWLEAYRELSDS